MYKKYTQDEKRERYVNICSHCGNNTSQDIIFKYNGTDVLYDVKGVPFDINVEYILVECSVCEKLMLYSKPEFEDDFLGYIIYPSQNVLSGVIPKKVKKAYDEARMVAKSSPNAFAVLIRRALEVICDDMKIKGRNLKVRMEKMSQEKMIPPMLVEMTDGLRILGNYGAHVSDVEFVSDDVELMDDFFNAILEYVYVAPEKINKFQKRFGEIKNKK